MTQTEIEKKLKEILDKAIPVIQHPDYHQDTAYDIDDVKEMIEEAFELAYEAGYDNGYTEGVIDEKEGEY